MDSINNDRDGISGPYDFTSITNNLFGFLPGPTANYSIKYYKTEADFLAETDALGNSLAITNTSGYRNIGFPNTQTIWVRVESTLDNSCYGFKTFEGIWDESYDDAEDDVRIERIASLLRSLDELPAEAKQDLFNQAQEIIEHNWNHFYNGDFEAILWTELKDMLNDI